MPKTFFLEPGLLARCDGLWYEPGILLVVEPGDNVEIFSTRDGSPGSCRAIYRYRQLDSRDPPSGLCGDWRGRRRVSERQRRQSLSAHPSMRPRHVWASARAVA
jgi:hypothetical protein